MLKFISLQNCLTELNEIWHTCRTQPGEIYRLLSKSYNFTSTKSRAQASLLISLRHYHALVISKFNIRWATY